MSDKPHYVLGVNEALCASAAILKDGKIIAAAAEERFTRIKNHWGFPSNAIKFCCEYAGIATKDIDLFVLSYIDPYPHFVTHQARELPDMAPQFLRKLRDLAPFIEYRLPTINALTTAGRGLYYKFYQPRNIERQNRDIAKSLLIAPEKILRINHHLCHAYATYYGNSYFKSTPTLVVTCDGAGDNVSATIYVVEGGKFKLFSTTSHTHSLGLFYAAITSHLGLKAHEDEYKVMGLAAYGEHGNWQEVYQIFEKLLWVENLKFNSIIPSRQFNFYLELHLSRVRFDYIAAAAQTFLENRLVEWIDNAVAQTQIKNVAFGGGIFLNVKANLEILKRTKISQAYFLPSPGDDTNSLGAAYFGYQKLCQTHQIRSRSQPLTTLYLGPHFSEADILQTLQKYKNKQLYIQKPKDITKAVAQLLAKGEIVARFCGRMEFGVRALGNRSILADPRRGELIERINQLIKLRDFWMPFAPTILAQDAHLYLKNPKKVPSPHMILAFETTKRAKADLIAALHPFDKTVRPQVLKRLANPSYYDLIAEFKSITNVGALLNTSFNLHGEPIVCTPHDALVTFMKSGLTRLQLEHYLISKKNKTYL